ncbi:MAG TPA: YkgJ family cysteine cluster protein [Fimbriimonadaceae bacterium]
MSASRLAEVGRGVMAALDRRIQQIQAQTPWGVKVDCKEGCSHCCHMAFSATIGEVASAAKYIEQKFSEEERAALRERLYRYERVVAPKFGAGLDQVRTPCPLLVEGLCSIYEARPMRCRGVNSLDVNVCIRKAADPYNSEPIPAIPLQLAASGVFQSGLKQGMAKAAINFESFDFGRALAIALEDPDTLPRSLRDGHVFLPAYAKTTTETEEKTIYDQETMALGIAEQIRLYQEGDTVAANAALKGSSPAVLIRKILAPRFYASEDEMFEWRARVSLAIEELGSRQIDPREGYEAMRGLETFEIAYQQLDDRALMSDLGDILVNKFAAKVFPQHSRPIEKRKASGKLKLGYISRNLSASNGGSWALGWLQNHGDDIETNAFFLGQRVDEVTSEFSRSATKFFHLPDDPGSNADFIKSQKLDALIYTDLGMDPMNHLYATLRLAPVQCTAWGHPITSGLPTIDYYLSSELMEPENGDEHYREKLVRLAGTGLCYSEKSYPASRLAKADFGLDEGPLLLCCQNPMKLHPRWDFLFREITEQTGRPIVFTRYLYKNVSILQERMQRAGINAVWAPSLTASDFLGLLHLADISLDTPGWNGGNTTIQALSNGIPVVTLPGEFMRGRHSFAFMKQCGADGLIADSPERYVELAVNREEAVDVLQKANPSALFHDKKPVASLDAFLRSVCFAE